MQRSIVSVLGCSKMSAKSALPFSCKRTIRAELGPDRVTTRFCVASGSPNVPIEVSGEHGHDRATRRPVNIGLRILDAAEREQIERERLPEHQTMWLPSGREVCIGE